MDINFIDTELNIKIKETFKYILKKPNVKIVFQEPTDDIVESLLIKIENNVFILEKYINRLQYKHLNEKYYPFLSDKLKNNIINLSSKQIKWKTFYLLIFKPFFGNIITDYSNEHFFYKMSYNAVILDITKFEYEKFCYYTRYVYKLQQLKKLNNELKINQEFNIIFDDDEAAHKMYDDLYENFKDIINPINDKYNKNQIDDNTEDDDIDDED